jgi:hypothetical protein
MSTIFKGLALFVLIAAATWVAVLWHWESSLHDVDGADILLFLAVLPVAAFALVLLLRSGWRATVGPASAPGSAAAAPAAGAATVTGATGVGGEAERHLGLQCLSAHLHVSGGSHPGELQAALQERRLRPQLDATLRRDNELPVLCGRVADLDVEGVAQAAADLVDGVRAQRAQWAQAEVPPVLWRSLALLAGPIEAALQALEPWADGLALEAPSPVPGLRREPNESLPRLRVVLAVPQACEAMSLALAEAWLAARCRDAGWPAERLVVQAATAAHAGDLWPRADAMLVAMHRQQRQDLLFLAAAHCEVDEDTVAALEQQGRLFEPERRPRGRMPGEGAAVVVLASPLWPADPQSEAPVVLHRAALVRRDKPIDAAGRPGHAELQQACEQALVAARVDAGQLAAVAADADQHTARATELFSTVLALAPQLDAGEDVSIHGAALGHTGAAGALVAIALARLQVATLSRPALAISSCDAQARLAWVLRPAAWPPPGTSAAPASPPPPTP